MFTRDWGKETEIKRYNLREESGQKDGQRDTDKETKRKTEKERRGE